MPVSPLQAEYGTAGGGSTAAAIGLMIERLTLAQEVMDTVRDAGATTGTIQHAQVVLKIAWIDFFDATSASNTLSATEIDGFIATQTETKGYLEQFSRFDWSPYCLAHVYTYTDFEGTLGLAWTAYPDSANHNGGAATDNTIFGPFVTLSPSSVPPHAPCNARYDVAVLNRC